ncbi:MAG: hypothetical protein G01um101444_47 [Parcubacteria group bacterium Gr01-1014_44]|nr:MAG: hypothetical protein G01um101444_47 [Parcubacteria group bacterium Gr01-1014_44]
MKTLLPSEALRMGIVPILFTESWILDFRKRKSGHGLDEV